MKKLSIVDVSNYFLKIVDRESGSTITPLKLQKILYYAQGFHLALKDKPLFEEEFEAWVHGPANKKIYRIYKDHGYGAIDEPNADVEINKETRDFLFKVWKTFGIYDGKYLEELTHKEEPWIEARRKYELNQKGDEIITKDSIKTFFKKQLNVE